MAEVKKELWQGYSEDGEPLEKALTPLQCAGGALHGAAHLWVWRIKDGNLQILLQKRSNTSKTWPGHYDVSVAGHINYGEKPLKASIREAREELGLHLLPDDLQLLFVHRQELRYEPAAVIENEIQWVYGFVLDGAFKLELQKSEVNSAGWVNFKTFTDVISGKLNGAKAVPHEKVYYAELIHEIRELSGGK
jgi:8-oxo-dGTP diphosphatase